MVMNALVDEPAEMLDHASVLARVEDWQKRIDALYRDLVAWLPPGFEADTDQSIAMSEKLMIAFGVPERRLPVLRVFEGGSEKAKVMPSGLWVLGADGRLNALTSKGLFEIVGRDPEDGGGWLVTRAPGGWELVDLDRSTWVEAIR